MKTKFKYNNLSKCVFLFVFIAFFSNQNIKAQSRDSDTTNIKKLEKGEFFDLVLSQDSIVFKNWNKDKGYLYVSPVDKNYYIFTEYDFIRVGKENSKVNFPKVRYGKQDVKGFDYQKINENLKIEEGGNKSNTIYNKDQDQQRLYGYMYINETLRFELEVEKEVSKKDTFKFSILRSKDNTHFLNVEGVEFEISTNEGKLSELSKKDSVVNIKVTRKEIGHIKSISLNDRALNGGYYKYNDDIHYEEDDYIQPVVSYNIDSCHIGSIPGKDTLEFKVVIETFENGEWVEKTISKCIPIVSNKLVWSKNEPVRIPFYLFLLLCLLLLVLISEKVYRLIYRLISNRSRNRNEENAVHSAAINTTTDNISSDEEREENMSSIQSENCVFRDIKNFDVATLIKEYLQSIGIKEVGNLSDLRRVIFNELLMYSFIKEWNLINGEIIEIKTGSETIEGLLEQIKNHYSKQADKKNQEFCDGVEKVLKVNNFDCGHHSVDQNALSLEEQVANAFSTLNEKIKELNLTISNKNNEISQERKTYEETIAALKVSHKGEMEQLYNEMDELNNKIEEISSNLHKDCNEYVDIILKQVDNIYTQICNLYNNVLSINGENNQYSNVLCNVKENLERFVDTIRESDNNDKWRCSTYTLNDVRKDLQQYVENGLKIDGWINIISYLNLYSGATQDLSDTFNSHGISPAVLSRIFSECQKLLGMFGVTVIVPHLLTEKFDSDFYKYGNADRWITTYSTLSPKDYEERIFDMSNVGYKIDDNIENKPSVFYN